MATKPREFHSFRTLPDETKKMVRRNRGYAANIRRITFYDRSHDSAKVSCEHCNKEGRVRDMKWLIELRGNSFYYCQFQCLHEGHSERPPINPAEVLSELRTAVLGPTVESNPLEGILPNCGNSERFFEEFVY